MEVNKRIAAAVRDSVQSLFYVKTNTDNEQLKDECQIMINNLYREFPEELPQPTSS